jgi:hypothetical protein
MGLVAKLQFSGFAFCRLDKPLRRELVKNGPFMRFQVCARTLQQIAKNRNFEVREIIRHDGPFDVAVSLRPPWSYFVYFDTSHRWQVLDRSERRQ